MAIPETGSISIKEAAGSTRSIDTAVTSTVSGSLVTLGTNSIDYTGGRSSGTNETDASPYSMLEYAGYAHTSMGGWPSISLPTGDAGGAFPGASGTEIDNWGFEGDAEWSGIGTAEAWCDGQFWRDDANNRIVIQLKSGTPAYLAEEYIGYINYSGMTSPTFWVKYNYTGTVTNLSNEASNGGFYAHPELNPAISKDTYRQMSTNGASGALQFFWIAYRDAPQSTASARVASGGVTFTVKIVSNSVDYTASMLGQTINLEATFGQLL